MLKQYCGKKKKISVLLLVRMVRMKTGVMKNDYCMLAVRIAFHFIVEITELPECLARIRFLEELLGKLAVDLVIRL